VEITSDMHAPSSIDNSSASADFSPFVPTVAAPAGDKSQHMDCDNKLSQPAAKPPSTEPFVRSRSLTDVPSRDLGVGSVLCSEFCVLTSQGPCSFLAGLCFNLEKRSCANRSCVRNLHQVGPYPARDMMEPWDAVVLSASFFFPKV
jgi:hypothetical protein